MGHLIGVALFVAGLVLVTAALAGLFGFWGLGAAGLVWIALAAPLIDVEVLAYGESSGST